MKLLSRIKRKSPAVYAHFCGLNTLPMADFSQLPLTTLTQKWDVSDPIESHSSEERFPDVNFLPCGASKTDLLFKKHLRSETQVLCMAFSTSNNRQNMDFRSHMLLS